MLEIERKLFGQSMTPYVHDVSAFPLVGDKESMPKLEAHVGDKESIFGLGWNEIHNSCKSKCLFFYVFKAFCPCIIGMLNGQVKF